MVPQEAECACCGQTMMRVVVIDGALTASVLAEPVAAEPFLVPQADGIYEERRQAWRLHAPHCPKWEGDTDWRSSAARIPIM